MKEALNRLVAARHTITPEMWADISAIISECQVDHASKKELYAALGRARKRAKAVEKGAENKHHGYKYASAESLIEEALECLSEEGLSFLVLDADRDPTQVNHLWEGDGKEAFIDIPRRMLIVYRLAHESGEELDVRSTVPVIPTTGRPEDKAEFGARTESYGYALRDLLGLPRVDAAAPSGRDDTKYEPRGRAAPAPERNPPRAAVPPVAAPVTLTMTSATVAAPSKLDMLAKAIDSSVQMLSMAALTGLHKPISDWPDKVEKAGLIVAYKAAKAIIEKASPPATTP